ncbi:polysaccharide export protein [Roseococcus sp. MDT2-1-1]|uniref:Polysaccharide export protein n=2 Tax=Sabulicella glaciei TaxID=2984948 RepID=A0ABT3NRM1_9PROT|nr:polysaccharide export protein [Roseococcus sp. MDT2-1-1]
MRGALLRGMALAALLGVVACAERPAPQFLAREGAPAQDSENYQIGPGDTLGIFVYRAPDLSVEIPVRPDGRISIPLAPDVPAAGKTPSQLARDLEQRLARYVREPNVTVMVRQFFGPPARMVRVVGEAAEPVAIPYRDGMTVLDVMIATRGLTRFAAGNRAELVRRDPVSGAARVERVRLNDLLRNGDMTQDVPLRPGDTLIIPQSWF